GSQQLELIRGGGPQVAQRPLSQPGPVEQLGVALGDLHVRVVADLSLAAHPRPEKRHRLCPSSQSAPISATRVRPTATRSIIGPAPRPLHSKMISMPAKRPPVP